MLSCSSAAVVISEPPTADAGVNARRSQILLIFMHSVPEPRYTDEKGPVAIYYAA